MLEQVKSYSPQSTQEHYTRYKDAVDKKNREVKLDLGETTKDQFIRFVTRTVFGGYPQKFNQAMVAPDKALEASANYFSEYQEQIIQEAINDAIATGVSLNLAENGSVQIAHNVTPLPTSEQSGL